MSAEIRDPSESPGSSRFIMILALLAVAILATGYYSYRRFERNFRFEVERQLESISDLKVRELVQWRWERQGDAKVLMQNQAFLALLRRSVNNPLDHEASQLLKSWLYQYHAYNYEHIHLLDPKGNNFISDLEEWPISNYTSRQIPAIFDSAKITFIDFFRDHIDNRIRISVVVPIVDPENNNEPLAAVVFCVDPETYLFPSIQRWPIPSKSAESLLMRVENDSLVYLNNLRFRENSALNFKRPLSQFSLKVQNIAFGKGGIIEGPDYRGEFVVAFVRPIPDSPWLMNTKMDRTEIFAPVRERLWLMVIVAVILLGIAVMAVDYFYKKQRLNFYEKNYLIGEALRVSEKKYRIIIENAAEAILVAQDGVIKFANGTTTRLSGYSLEELTARPFLDFVHPDDQPLVANYSRIRLGGGNAPENYEIRLYDKARNIRWAEMAIALTEWEGRPATINFLTDITIRKQSEIARTALQVQLAQAQKMEAVGRLAGGVAHDFNNMLSVILGHADLALMQMKPSDPAYDDINEILDAGYRSADLTKQLLAFSRQQTAVPKSLKLDRSVTDARKMLQRMIGEEISLKVTTTGELWPTFIDQSQIDQVLANLCVNARDAIGGVGSVIIELVNVSVEESMITPGFASKPGDYVMLAVRDTGSGMDVATMEHIFEPFFTTKAEGKGTGLGLATVFGIVQQNGGFIYLYSELGLGTTFKIYFPRYHGSAEKEVEKTVTDLPTGTETILVVEDEKAVLGLVRTILEKAGYNVLSAAEPAEALQLIEHDESRIDMLLTDVVMPGMNGKQLAERILALRPGIKVVFMSGYTSDIIADRGLVYESVNFIHKPISREAVLRKIREVLDG